MSQRLKSWESPRRQGRNNKGKGGAARRRQIKKQMKLLRKKLKGETIEKQNYSKSNQKNKSKSKRRELSPFFFYYNYQENINFKAFKL